MGNFTKPTYSRPLDRIGRLQTMADMPFTLSTNLLEQAKQGALDSYGLGTVIREGMTPQGNTVADATPSFVPNPAEALGRIAQNVGGMIRGDQAQPSLSKDEYEASDFYREGVPFEEGMTEDRAAALASFYDTKKVREYFGAKRPISTFLGQFVGQAFDPINYVPVFGPAAEVAATARFGSIAGRALVGASDAAINTAAFGVLTSGMRAEFGDDVSWQAMVNEIGMSALIGGAFGAVSPVIRSAWSATVGRNRTARAREAEAKTASNLANIQNLKESNAVLNEAVGQLVDTGEVNLSPNSQAIVERIQGDVVGRAASMRQLDEQTATVNTSQPVAITPSGQRVNVRPEVVDASTLSRATGDLQVRNRSNAASASQVEEIAVNLDPARLMPSVDADSGAPIVGGDNIIDSGNGRVSAIVRAYEAYPARAQEYRAALEAQGYDLTGIERPVLINRRTTELTREARALFNAEANAPRAAQMSAVELAAMDANAIADTLDILDPSPVTSPANRAFVQRFVGNLTPSARGALVDNAGNLNADGARRIENALVAAAYGDVDIGVLRRFAEATDDNTRAIVGAMSDVAGQWAIMRQAIKRGDISPEYDMTAELTEALRRIGGWREQATREKRPVSQVIKEGMAQLDMLSGEISPEAQVIIGAFYRSNSFAQAAGRDTISEFLRRVVSAAEELGRPQLFDDANLGRLEFVRNAAVNEQGNLFAPVGSVEGFEADGGFSRRVETATDRQGGGQAASQRGSITDRLTERFSAAGRPEAEARATAEIVDAFYTQQAARLGLTMDEMVERFGLPEVRSGAADAFPEAAMAQSPQSPAFREWFGDSKVVDANGEPLVVYHGGAAGIEQFESSSWRYREFMTEAGRANVVNANFFATERSTSQSYIERIERQRFRDSDPAGEMYEVYLKLENPLEIDWRGKRFTTGDPSKLIEQAKAGGHDGLKVTNVIDDYRQKGKPTTIYVTFAGEQIKSVNNRGTFDPNDPRILFQANTTQYKVKPPKKLWRGVVEGQQESGQAGLGTAMLGRGLYSSPDRSFAKMYATGGKLVEVPIEAGWPRNPLVLNGAGGGPSLLTDWIFRTTDYKSMRDFNKDWPDPSEFVKSRGYDGVIAGDEVVRYPDEPGGTILFQQNRGAIQLGDQPIITLFETADASTALHETGHMFLSMLKGMGDAADAPDAIKADWESVQGWWRDNAEAVAADANASGRAEGVTAQNVIDALDIGTTGDAAKDRAIDVGMQEQWARGFEAYVREGNAPSAGLARAFEQFKQWLTAIYRRASDLNVNLSDDIRRVFDNLLADPQARAVPEIDGVPVRLGQPSEPRATSEVASLQASLLDNGPEQAAARIGKDESIREIALSHGVDPTTGGYVEAGDIAQLREEGRLTADDEAELAGADQAFETSEAYGRALEAAVRCLL